VKITNKKFKFIFLIFLINLNFMASKY